MSGRHGAAPPRPGVYLVEPAGGLTLAHGYSDEALDYCLEDLPELLGYGIWEEGEPPGLTLETRELRALAVEADARSFDLDEGLVALCRDLREATRERPEGQFLFLDYP